MNPLAWLRERMFGHVPDERSTKGARIDALEAEAMDVTAKAQRALAERRRLASAVQGTVKAVRR